MNRWHPMNLTARSGGWLFAIALAGCADSPASPGAQAGAELPPGLLISEPVRSGAALATDTEELALAYISASPGTFPDGISATITNLANGETVTVEIVDGGYDPVALKALPDDELEITVRNPGGGFTNISAYVGRAARPRIVRTRPPNGDTDVVLTFFSLDVVFSEPMDPSTVTQETIKLLADGAPVDVTTTLRVDGLLAQLTPTASPGTSDDVHPRRHHGASRPRGRPAASSIRNQLHYREPAAGPVDVHHATGDDARQPKSDARGAGGDPRPARQHGHGRDGPYNTGARDEPDGQDTVRGDHRERC